MARSFQPGDKLAGCYTLKEILPLDGPAVVWLAHDEELDKDLTLHFLPDSVVADSRAMEELRQAARRNRQLIHPRILRVHDLIEEGNWAAFSMDAVQGESVAALQRKKENGAFDVSEISRWAADLCQTIEDAHRVDLLHRDLAPENLLVTKNGGLMLMNFGIRRAVLDSLARRGQSPQDGSDVAYLSPQQIDGERPGKWDDVYSIGAVLFHLLTGKPPFHTGDLIPQIRKEVPPSIAERRAERDVSGEAVPQSWENAIAACLAKHVDERPKSASEVNAKLSADKSAAAPGAAVAGAPLPAAPKETEEKSAAAEAAAASDVAAPADESREIAGTETAAETHGEKDQPLKSRGPAKTPVIAEAEVLSHTPVEKSETPDLSAAEGAKAGGERVGGPTTPSGFPLRAFVEVGDEKEAKPKSGGAGTAFGIAAALAVIGAIIYLTNGGGEKPAEETAPQKPAMASNAQSGETANDSSEAPQPSPAAPAAVQRDGGDRHAPAAMAAASASPATNSAPTPAPVAMAPAAPKVARAASPAPAPSAVAILANSSMHAQGAPLPMESGIAPNSKLAQAIQAANEKLRAADSARQALAVTQAAQQEKAKAQQQAQAGAAEIGESLKQKTAALAQAKKAADDAAAAAKQREEAQAKADAEADAAQKAAVEKARVAADMRKAADDSAAAIRQLQTAAQKAEADSREMEKLAAERQRIAQENARAAADAQAALQKQAAAAQQADAEAAQARASVEQIRQASQVEAAAREQAAREAAARQAEVAKQQAALDAQARQVEQQLEQIRRQTEALQKQRDEIRSRAETTGRPEAAVQPSAAPARSPSAMTAPAGDAPAGPAAGNSSSPSPAAVVAMIATATPAEQPAAAPANPKTATVTARVPNPKSKVEANLENSLGMKFVPVGQVLFSVWLTRVQDFEAFAKATGFKPGAWRQPGFKQGPDHPVVNVSWNDAMAFCDWLTRKEKNDGLLAKDQFYRLPMDMEWSQAVGLPEETGRTPEARDMDVPDLYPWGAQWPPTPGAGNYTGEETDSDVAIKNYNDGFPWTSPVGSFNPNALGLYDMGGNVCQWCMDWYNSEQKTKVLRGGSWYNGALKMSLLSSARIYAAPMSVMDTNGFRVVLASGDSRQGRH